MEFRGRGQSDKPQHRINEQIRAASVRVVGENVEPGVYPVKEALAMAEAAGADLVEISPNADPPVCRIIDYSKFLYQLKKKQKELKARGKILAVATSKPEVYAKKICEHFGLSQYFDCICGSGLDGSFYHKCDVINKTLDTFKIEPSEAVMVGDRKYDIIGAKQCNMLSIGVRCGFSSDNELEDAGADYVVDNLSGLFNVHLF